VTDEPDFKLDDSVTERDLLFRIARELTTIRKGVSQALYAMGEAEKEVPEKMRRFMNYFHDVVHVKGEYVTLGLTPPKEIDQEMERNHDRALQILHDLHSDGGHFEKVRREMTTHPVTPRYDHSRQLAKPTPTNGEAK
jgi:hypothetical protein